MKKLVILIIAVAASAALSAQTPRQITFANKGISVGEGWTSPYRVDISGFEGIEFTNGNGWLKFDLRASQLSISGSNNIVQFYSKRDDFFNAVRCSYFNVMSDSCLKKDIRPLDSARPLFSAKEERAESGGAEASKKEPVHTDMVAAIAARYPGLACQTPEGRTLVNYAEIVPVLIKEIQEIESEISNLSEEINQLKNELP